MFAKTCQSTCHHVSDRAVSLHPLISSSLSSVSTSCPNSSPPLLYSSSMWSEPPSNKSPVHPQNEEYGPVATQKPLSQVMSPSSPTTSTTQRLVQRSSGVSPSTHGHGTVALARRGTRRRAYQKKRYLHHCSLRSEKNQRT